MRTEHEMTETAGNPLIPENPDNHHLGPSRATTHVKHATQVLEDQESYTPLDWVVLRSGFEHALQAYRGRIERNGREPIDQRKP